MRALIIDDDAVLRRKLRRMLESMPAITIVGDFGDPRAAAAVARELDPDAVFLDIELPGINGVDLARELQSQCRARIAFVTAHDVYAVTAFEMDVVDYVLKPVDRYRLERAVDRMRSALQTEPGVRRSQSRTDSRKHLLLKVDERQVVVDMREIRYIEAEGNYIRYSVGSQKFLSRGTMNAAEAVLTSLAFCRISRSTIVNVTWIRSLEDFTPQGDCVVVIKDGSRLSLTRNYRRDLEERLLRG